MALGKHILAWFIIILQGVIGSGICLGSYDFSFPTPCFFIRFVSSNIPANRLLLILHLNPVFQSLLELVCSDVLYY